MHGWGHIKSNISIPTKSIKPPEKDPKRKFLDELLSRKRFNMHDKFFKKYKNLNYIQIPIQTRIGHRILFRNSFCLKP